MGLAWGCQDDLDDDGAGGSGAGAAGGAGGAGGQGGGTAGAGTLILAGTIVTPAEVIVGQVRIEGATIVCVAEGTACSDEAPAATLVDTGGVIAPGLIDTHNHILFDIFDDDDWVPTLPTCGVTADCESSPYCDNGECACMDGACKYTDHTQWPEEAEYGLMLDYKQCLEDASQGKPVWCPRRFDEDGDLKCEMDKWGELKGLIAGTTSIVGLPGNSGRCFESIARSIDVDQNGFEEDKVQTSALFPPSNDSASGACENFQSGDTAAYLIHVGEGVTTDAQDEFAELFDVSTPPGCLYAPQTTITHGTAFTAADFAQMAQAGMKLTWSPASNLALYGTTTDIPAALDAGVLVALAPDWSMGGSQNLLDELRVAGAWDDDHFGDRLDDKALVQMVTENAAAVLGLSDTIGRVEVGLVADLAVYRSQDGNPYQSITQATPADVRLVMIGGELVYGDPEIFDLRPAVDACEPLEVCGVEKLLCISRPGGQDGLDQTYAEIEAALSEGLDELDALDPLPPASCTPACDADEACFVRTVHEEVPEAMCPSACAAGEACFQTSQSGSDPYECLTINACAPVKSKSLAPLAPIVKCP
jgi:5-methylthioadenosine/S-adenosylhomocysteine deaminase